MGRADIIRRELEEAEKKVNKYRELIDIYQRGYPGVYNLDFFHLCLHHYMSRRRFFLRELLRIQLKEFNHEVLRNR